MKFKIIEFEKLPSTQQKLVELAKEKKVKPWTVIVAKEQTEGRGREEGRIWFSAKGGLYFSVLLPSLCIEDVELLSILLSFSVAKVLKEKFNVEIWIKLPNDIYLNQKKICGILTQNFFVGKDTLFTVAGIGLNTNLEDFPEDLKEKATSLKIELKREIDNKEILEEILKEISKNILAISR
jgi:BirA family biotin operon repressor/biotin-[acetyl-CoA-carboxylase] ligase